MAKFCLNCGVIVESKIIVVCPNCGHILKEETLHQGRSSLVDDYYDSKDYDDNDYADDFDDSEDYDEKSYADDFDDVDDNESFDDDFDDE